MGEEFRRIGVANSVFADQGFNPEKTILWAEKNGFQVVQLYLTYDLCFEVQRLEMLSQLLEKSHPTLLVHSPDFDLFSPVRAPVILRAASRLFSRCSRSEPRGLVWHIHPEHGVEEHLCITTLIEAHGLRSCPENYLLYRDSLHAILATHRYVSIIQTHGTIPVLDLSRFFVLSNPYLVLTLVDAVVSAANHHPCIIIHVTDGRYPVHDRSGWCPPGAGIVGWHHLGPRLMQSSKSAIWIAEYEDRENALQTKRYLEAIG